MLVKYYAVQGVERESGITILYFEETEEIYLIEIAERNNLSAKLRTNFKISLIPKLFNTFLHAQQKNS